MPSIIFIYPKRNQKNMSVGEIMIPMGEEYPFNGLQQHAPPRTQLKVKKTLDNGLQPRFVMKQKIRMLKNLGFQHLIGLQTTVEEQNRLNLIFQYIPFRFQTQISTLNAEAIETAKESMYKVAENFAMHSVEHEFRIENIGLDRKGDVKYFVGFNFRIDRTMKREDTLQRYKRIIEFFFASGGPLIKSRSPNKSIKNQYYETVDTSCKLSYSEESSHHLLPTSNLMKKSSTVPENVIKGPLGPSSKQLLARYTFNCNNELTIPEEERKYYDQQKNVQTKAVKMQELGARINRLKTYMKEITGKTPTNTSGLARLTVKIDANNNDNRIFQENKIMITPSYTKLEKKIAEYRESKLYRAYNQKQILYSKNNQGYQVHTTQRIQDSSRFQSNDQQTIEYSPAQTEPEQKSVKPQEERSQHVPSYLLQKKENAKKQSPITSPKSQPKTQSLLSPPTPTNDSKPKSFPFDPIHSGNLNSSKNTQVEPSDPQEKEYRKLAEKDKYCEQFMFFLQGDDEPEMTCTNDHFDSPPPSFHQLSQKSESLSKKGALQPTNQQIQDRVKLAIRNSIKLINGLKYKDQ